MAQSFVALRLVLLGIAAVLLAFGYLFIFVPGFFGSFYSIEGFPDFAHTHLSMFAGVLLLVYGIGALLATVRPHRSTCMVMLLILLHFAVFIFDVVCLAQGQIVQLWYLLTEMVYALAVCVLLIRFFPVQAKADLSETAGVLVDAFQEQLKKREKAERKRKPQGGAGGTENLP